MNNEMIINVLGTPYRVDMVPESEDPKLETMDGYTDPSIKRIVISDVSARPEDPEAVQDQDWFQRNIIRHELIHAFVVESGNQDAFWHCEDMVRWLAYMFPRLVTAFHEAGAMEPCGNGVVLDGVYHPTTDELKKMFSHSPDMLSKDGFRQYPDAADEVNYYNSVEASGKEE